ncbi:STAS/SEC14 domain-containing protein [Photobacterium leiognathi]|uniref:STAS/SEC14 domain-containing protein n=1 Tax=Photobacterium leiognathi TaxID=553611 RepID=UPI002739A18F|nr:STAS/SEC14 domain-containing protein [Photobacterium leiognathi]
MTKSHGIQIEIDNNDGKFFVEIKATGKLTHHDYQMITPEIDTALEGVDKPVVDVYFDGTACDGLDLHAAWDDLELGLKHGKSFRKVALYGNKHWQELGAKVGNWFMSGEVRYFDDAIDALNWLKEA